MQNVLTLPKDTDDDDLADHWEMEKLGSLSYLASDDPDGDELTNLEEYRGFMWGQLIRVEPNATYSTAAYVPDPVVAHFRTDPRDFKDLFVKFSNFDAEHPFAIGEAYHLIGISVHAVDALQNPGEENIGVVTVNNEIAETYGNDDGHINKRGKRDWYWDIKGFSGIGTVSNYGLSTTYQSPLDLYFDDKPYRDLETPNSQLEPMEVVQDHDDDGINDRVTGKWEAGCSDINECPWTTDVVVMSNFLPQFGFSLNPMDIDSNYRVEHPMATVPNSINLEYEYSKAQVLKHTISHELGHGIGMTDNADPDCLMCGTTKDWRRDWYFSALPISEVKIHNP